MKSMRTKRRRSYRHLVFVEHELSENDNPYNYGNGGRIYYVNGQNVRCGKVWAKTTGQSYVWTMENGKPHKTKHKVRVWPREESLIQHFVKHTII